MPMSVCLCFFLSDVCLLCDVVCDVYLCVCLCVFVFVCVCVMCLCLCVCICFCLCLSLPLSLSVCLSIFLFSNYMMTKSKGRCAPGTNAFLFSALHGTCTITWQRTRVLYSTSNRRAPYEYCSRILLRAEFRIKRGVTSSISPMTSSFSSYIVSAWLRVIQKKLLRGGD